jgi:hypothetical protein
MIRRFNFLLILGLGLLFISRMPVVQATQTDATAVPTTDSGMADMSGKDLPLETAKLIDSVRAATVQFRDLATAEEAGYGKFETCFHYGDNLGMGQHYVNGTLAGDDVVDPMKPEALVYEPLADGSQILVAFEYLVFADKWDPNNTGREAPTVFGQPMMLLTNIPDTPPVWGLHLWLWTDNPDGLFQSFNPLVSCPDSPDNIDMSTR